MTTSGYGEKESEKQSDEGPIHFTLIDTQSYSAPLRRLFSLKLNGTGRGALYLTTYEAGCLRDLLKKSNES